MKSAGTTQMKPQVSIIVINHDTPEMTQDTLKSVRDSVGAKAFEIVVVDNSDRLFLDVTLADRYIRTENRGFANACNIGARESSGEYLLFLNSDVIVSAEAISLSAAYLRTHPEAGVLGIHTLLPDGTLDGGCKRGFPTPFASLCYFLKLDRIFPRSHSVARYHMLYLPEDQTQAVESVSGAYLMTPRAVFDKLDGWDEDFFMYGEDIDFCYRAKKAGYETVYFADASIVHKHGGSSTKSGKHAKSDAFYESMRIFYDKHYQAVYPRLVSTLVHAGIALKRRVNGK